ncbi:alpha/beta hydrolase [Tomitella biformata]|uniref:alpha/beta hydrolase n=1 Tax=Tomitella biformata TaxID=630403 RepID=UPI0004B32278|nr:alpha/beta hydrolase [Tomitella biformata]
MKSHVKNSDVRIWGGNRLVRTISLLSLTAAVASACAAGPSLRPDIAVSGQSGGVVDESTPPAAETVPPMEVPTEELSWRDCTARTLTELGLPPGPGGLTLECATLRGELDPDTTPASTNIDVMRASTAATPADAPPLVLTAGADQPSTTSLAVLATGPRSGLLDQYPVVAVDRRGLGVGTNPDCLTTTDRTRLTEAAGRTVDPTARAEDMMGVVSEATVACTDMLRPSITQQDARHAAADLDTLRQAWGVERLAILAVGSGSRVALTYATELPDALSRLILDSPASVDADAQQIAEGRAQADQAALAALVQLCAAADCGLGPDPAARIDELLAKVRRGEIPSLSVGAVLSRIRQSVAAADQPWEVRATQLGRLLSDALAGNPDAVGALAATVAITDGQFTASCSDAPPAATPEQSAAAQTKWQAQYPQFGADSAVRMLTCSAWPSHEPPPAPNQVPIPVLILSGAADPVVGAGSADTVTAALDRTGTKSTVVSWAGVGHGAMWNSECAATEVVKYLAEGALPTLRTACPA